MDLSGRIGGYSLTERACNNIAPLRGKVDDQDPRVLRSQTRSVTGLNDEDQKFVHAPDLPYRMLESALRLNNV